MPASSKAQFRQMFVLYKRGKITKAQLDDFTKGVDYKHLPARVKKTKKRRNHRTVPTRVGG